MNGKREGEVPSRPQQVDGMAAVGADIMFVDGGVDCSTEMNGSSSG